jgi:Holliday junction DNA helicase RuvA
MIAGLHGFLADVEESAVIVDLHGFLVRAFAPGSTLGSLGAIGDSIRLHTYLAVREDALTLYGFATKAELQFFELLIGVNGVGPRAALGLLTFADPGTIYQAIADEDTTLLSRAPGIGKVTAGRIILDLKRKLPDDFAPTLGGAVDNRDQETVAALESLGYTSAEARNALAAVDNRSGMTIEERIIAALRNMDDGQ